MGSNVGLLTLKKIMNFFKRYYLQVHPFLAGVSYTSFVEGRTVKEKNIVAPFKRSCKTLVNWVLVICQLPWRNLLRLGTLEMNVYFLDRFDL